MSLVMNENKEKILRIGSGIFTMLLAAYELLGFTGGMVAIGLLNTFLGSGVTSSFLNIWMYFGVPVAFFFFASGITIICRKKLFSLICNILNLVYVILSWIPSLVHTDFRFPIWFIFLQILNLLLAGILWFQNKSGLT